MIPLVMTGQIRRPILLCTFAATSIFLPGCVYRSKIKQKIPSPPEAFSSTQEGKENTQEGKEKDPGRFWELFQDPQLNKLMARVLRDNLDLAAAWARVEGARAQLKLARAGTWPRLSAKGEAGRSSSTMEFGEGIGSRTITRNTLQLSASVAYEVDLWGRVRYSVEAGRRELEASAADLEAAMLSLAAQLVESYFLAAELRAQLVLLDQTIESRGHHVDLVRRRYAEGVVTALDLYQAQGSLAAARARRTTFISQLRTAEHAVAVMAGRPPGEGLTGQLDQLPAAVQELPVGLPAQLLLRRPDLRAAHERLMAADARVGAAVAAHYPTLSLSASLGYSFDPAGIFWSLLGGLTAPLFEGNRIAAEVDLNQALLKQALAGYKSTLLVALKEVEDALIIGQQLEEQVRHLEESETASEGALRMSTEQYAQGLISYLPVLTAEQSVYTVRSEILAARRQLISARVQLARALGGGWMAAEAERRAADEAGEKAQLRTHNRKRAHHDG